MRFGNEYSWQRVVSGIATEASFSPSVALLFDWRPDMERLKDEAHAAQETGRSDPYAIVEVECWLDLVGAEIVAHQAGDPELAEIAAGLDELTRWRDELQLARTSLRNATSHGICRAA